jgi:hypothetical protein
MGGKAMTKQTVINQIEKQYAKYELQYALLDGVFETGRKKKNAELSLRKVEGYLDYTDKKGETHKEAVHLELLVPYLLNTQAEDVLLALIRLSGIYGSRNKLEIESTQPTLPVLSDTAEGQAKEKMTAITIVRQYELLKEAGMGDSKEHYRLLRQYLKQMSEIRVHYENKATKWFGSDYFLKYHANEDGRLIVQLNWRLAGAIFGEYLYTEIDLNERHTLEKDASKTLHRWLSAHLWQGRSEYITYERLISHIWTQKVNPTTQRKRLERLKREILPEIAKLDKWMVEMGREGAKITHHKA